MSAPGYAIRPPQPDCATRCGAWSIEDARAAVLRAMPDVREDGIEFSRCSYALAIHCDGATLAGLDRLAVEFGTRDIGVDMGDELDNDMIIAIAIPEAP